MKTDAVIRYEGMKLLLEHLGLVEAEKFISLIRGSNFNYTEWQRNLWKEQSLDDIFEAAWKYTKFVDNDKP